MGDVPSNLWDALENGLLQESREAEEAKKASRPRKSLAAGVNKNPMFQKMMERMSKPKSDSTPPWIYNPLVQALSGSGLSSPGVRGGRTTTRGRKSIASRRASRRMSRRPSRRMSRRPSRRMSTLRRTSMFGGSGFMSANPMNGMGVPNSVAPDSASLNYWDGNDPNTWYEGQEYVPQDREAQTLDVAAHQTTEEANKAKRRNRTYDHQWRLIRQKAGKRKKSLKLTAATQVLRAVQMFEHKIKNEYVVDGEDEKEQKVSTGFADGMVVGAIPAICCTLYF